MPAARCRYCGFGYDAHHLRSYFEKEGAEPKIGFSCTLTECPGFQDINAQLNARLEARRRESIR